MLRNTNYEAKKTGEFKDEGTVNELSGVLGYKTSLPLKKDGTNYSKLLEIRLNVLIWPLKNIGKNQILVRKRK